MKNKYYYHIAGVIDYKGGELRTCFNLTYEEFIEHIIDFIINRIDSLYECFEMDETDTILYEENGLTSYFWNKYVNEKVLFDWFYDQFDIYAGGDSRVEEWFRSSLSDPKLKEYTLTDEDKDTIFSKVKDNICEN